MKFVFAFLAIFLATSTWVSAQSLAVNGSGNDGYIGSYDVNEVYYWWLCVEPEGTPTASSGGFLAYDVSLAAGWTTQNTERTAFYTTGPDAAAAQAALAKQIDIIEYVLDVYLPISTLSTPGALTQDDANPGYYGNNVAFYNAMFAVQQFLSETYGKPTRTDFTDLAADYTDRWSGDMSAAGIARSQLFQSILDDIEAKDLANFFAGGYDAINDYFIANTPESLSNTNPLDPEYNWQDVLLIAIPVPEPSGALMIACCGLAVMMRRWRKLA